MRVDDPERQRTLIAARRYYYTRHLPLRHFKTLALSIRDIPEGITWDKLKWMGELFWSAIYNPSSAIATRRRSRHQPDQRAQIESARWRSR